MFVRRGVAALRKRVQRARREWFGAWTVSLLVHLLLLFMLSCFIFQRTVRETLLTMMVEPTDLATQLELVPPAPSLPEPTVAADLANESVELSSRMSLDSDLVPLEEMELLDLNIIEDLKAEPESPTPTLPKSPRGTKKTSPWPTREPSTTESIKSAEGVVAALGPIEQAIRDEVKQGNTLVVWLMDASISLQLNRHLLAGRLEEFQKSLGMATRKQALAKRDSAHQLFNSVVAFGQGVNEIQAPVNVGLRAVDKLKRVDNDPSGIENTMSAINQVVNRYRRIRPRDERMLIVLLTDESGDDGIRVEETVQNCRHHGVAVHVIGPTAVMGLQEGSQLWTSAANQRFLLRVKRGPETCLPERAFLPYWHEVQLSAWRPDVRPADQVPWYGGEYREGVLSGFGPYTLTRLALQTGGSYTLFDQREDARYQPDRMRPYLPEYGSLGEYQAAIGRRPLRMFVAQAAAMTLQHEDKFVPLRMRYFGRRSPVYPFKVESQYINPGAFRGDLKDALRLESVRALEAMEKIETLLQAFADVDLEYEYSKEESPRWRAWYDLTHGRLLAASVRYAEFIASAGVLSSKKPPFDREVNEIMLLPGPQLLVSASVERAALATKLLERCKRENDKTPWADLAHWELLKDFGFQFQAKANPEPPPVVNNGFQPGQMGFKGQMGLRGSGGGGGGMAFPAL